MHNSFEKFKPVEKKPLPTCVRRRIHELSALDCEVLGVEQVEETFVIESRDGSIVRRDFVYLD